MLFKNLSTGDVFAVIAPTLSPIFRKTYAGGVEEVRGGDYTGKIISRTTKITVRANDEVQQIDPGSITGKLRK